MLPSVDNHEDAVTASYGSDVDSVVRATSAETEQGPPDVEEAAMSGG